jgi:hypothetical protein
MVQTYGVIKDNTAEPGASGRGEQSALLGNDSSSSPGMALADGHASLISCVSNLANTIIGSGECPSKPLIGID